MSARQADAFSLVELTLALGVAAFCLLSVIALVPVAQTSHLAASAQTTANNLTSDIVSDLRATQQTTPPSSQTSPRFQLIVGASGSSSIQTLYFREGGEVIGPPGTPASQGSPAPRYRATVFLAAPSAGRGATTGRVLVTWPALADPDPSPTPSKYIGSLETFVALDRN